ncbi:hypothetical protein GJAV_G00202930 [Gymnothorax javanicus]|nr:hypothetical protein GJAV_G00202930 [Gymnothorax javanicus]
MFRHIVYDTCYFCCCVWHIVITKGVRMMATVHATASSLIPLLESLEDATAGPVEQTDAYLTIANRLSGEDGKHFLPAVVKHFSRLGKVFQAHIVSPNVELSQAALQALGFCAFHSAIVSGIPAGMVEDILVALNGIVVKSIDKNTCTRALWVISKQNFPSDVVARKVPDILKTLEAVRAREDLQSVIMEHEALNVVIRLLEQTPNPMGEGAVQWSKLVIPLVVHSASKVRLRAAAALEMGMPLLLRKQQEVAAVIEPLMSSKLIPELQKLFSAKNESNVLKLWPLFVRLLGKLLHRGGPFINSLLHLEELGFRSSSPIIKKIAFIAWKSLIDNFALNPEILCSAKRLKLLMQPLSSIQVRTEMLLLTKLEVWWYLVVRLGPNLAANFEQVGIPLLQIAVSRESPNLPAGTPSRNSSLNASLTTPKAGGSSFSSSSSTPRLGLNSSGVGASPAFPSIQLLGLEMLLHYLLGAEVSAAAAKSKLQLSLEPLTHALITSPSSFSKYAGVLIPAVRDSFIGIGKDAPDAVLTLVWKNLIGFVTAVMEMGNKKDKPGSEVLTLLLQALESIVVSEALPPQRTMGLLEATVKGIPRKILGSAAYQVANMDVLNGTPALFLILLFHHSSVLPSFVTDERFFLCLETLIGCGLSGPSSPLAFSESVLGVMSRNAEAIQNKEHLWRMWSIVVNPLTDTITQTNEVNQGDALEHNFAAVHCALMFPISHLLVGHVLPQMTQKSLLATWSRLYKAFARCSALVATAEENVCCEELCSKMAAILDAQILSNPSTLEAVASILFIISECVDFSPYTPHYQKTKSPHTPLGWNRKKNKPLGNLTTFQTLLVQVLESFLTKDASEMMTECGGVASGGAATALVSILSTLFSNLLLGTAVLGALSTLCAPLSRLYEHAGRPQNEQPKFFTGLGPKLEKLLAEILGCLQTRSSLVYDDELLDLLSPLLCVLFPHRSKQMRTLVSQFWNATFANSPTLTYPENLKPILSRVKQNMPIILPGFQAVDVPEDFSGQYPADSSESSQFEANLSGVKMASVGKRDSLLSRAGPLGEKASNTPSKPIAQVKLDFGSPMRPRRELLEEEASLDFVFIPPESKERVLTEHQKEVKRTKRVDIPAMYNNLDASLDTTVFTQYTQSQDDTMDKPVADEEPAEMLEKNNQAEVQGGKMKTAEAEPEVEPALEEPVADSTDDVAGKGESSLPLKEIEPRSVDIPLKQNNMGAEDVENETKESIADDCNVSTSSDVVSGTPPKPNSRRQSFITLEKYVEGKSASPMSITKFTGPLSRASNSQDASCSQQKNTDSLVFHEVSAYRETEQELGDCCDQQESPHLKEQLPEVKGKQHHPQVEEVRKSHPSDGTEVEDEVIPDTQTEVDSMDIGRPETQDSDEATDSTKDEDPYMYDSCEDNYLYDSQCLQVSASQSEIRRSGRRRSRPLRPGEDREEVEGRYQLLRKSSLGKGSQTDAAKADPSPVSPNEGYSPGRPRRGTKIAVVQGEEVKERLRKNRADCLTLSSQMSQNASQSLGRVTRSRAAGPAENALSNTKTTPVGQMARRSLGRSKMSQAVSQIDEPLCVKDDHLESQKDSSQTDSQSLGKQDTRSKSSAELNVSNSLSVTATVGVKEEGTVESFQDFSQLQTGEFSECSVGNSPLEVSESSEDGRKYGRRGHKRKLRNSEAKPCSPLKTKKVPEISEHIHAKESSPKDGMEDCKNLDPVSISINTNTEGVELSEVQEKRHLTEVDAPDGTVGSLVESNMSSSEAFSSVPTEMQRDVFKPLDDPSFGIGDLATNTQKARNKRVCRRPRSKGYDSRTTRESPGSEVSSLQGSDSLDSEEIDIESLGHGKTITEATCVLPENSLSQQQDDMGENKVFLEANVASAQSLSECLPAAAAACETEEASRKTVEESSSADDSKVQADIEASEWAEDFEEGQRLDSDMPGVSDVAEGAVDLAQEQESEENLDIQGQGMNQEEVFASVQEQNAPKEAAPEEFEEDRVTQIDSDMPLEAAGSTAIQVLPEELPDPQQVVAEPLCLESPLKQKHLDSVVEEVLQSPSSGKTKGVWSPSASPSTSILKKGQKRPLEVESPSPLHKSRRVSFADPIHHQELADDIDRRSPVIRPSTGSSPRSKNTSTVLSQQKFITTPTRGLVTLSPRSLRSPGYKSPKKCLISEMSQEPKPIPRDCVFPALVGCSAPVEAVLPQITSNMWPRGFGQLVRARNIKTVGDLSALTPAEIKSLPIRSPKLSSVKKALKNYHDQQRKGRSDELKGFDEMEKMTSEPEETDLTQQQEDVKPSVEPVAELSDVPVLPPAEPRPAELPSVVEELGARLTQDELGQCSPGQLVLMHEQLGGMMRAIVGQLQARLTPSLGESLP